MALLVTSACGVQIPSPELGAIPDTSKPCLPAQYLHSHCSALPGWSQWGACEAAGVGLWSGCTGGDHAAGAGRWRATQCRWAPGVAAVGARPVGSRSPRVCQHIYVGVCMAPTSCADLSVLALNRKQAVELVVLSQVSCNASKCPATKHVSVLTHTPD